MMTMFKNTKNLFGIKIVTVLLIPIFLFSSISFAFGQKIGSLNTTLGPYLISQIVDEYNKEYSWQRVIVFEQELTTRYAKGLVEKVMKRVKESGREMPISEIEQELVEQINARIFTYGLKERSEQESELTVEIVPKSLKSIAQGKPEIKIASQQMMEGLISVIKKEFLQIRIKKERVNHPKPGHLAGFGEEELGFDKYGIDLHDLLNQATAEKIKGAGYLTVKNLISNNSKLDQLSSWQQNLKVYSLRGWINTFCELYRNKLKEKGLTEPYREEMIRQVKAQIIAHPSTYSGYDSIYTDEVYFNILFCSENSDDLFLSLVKHESMHIGDSTATEKFVNSVAPIDNIRKAIKEKTILIVQSGGDCAGLNTVVASAAVELEKLGWRVVGVEKGFTGLVSENFEDFHIPIDGYFASRIQTRPTTDLKYSREHPFKIVEDIQKNKRVNEKAYDILMDIQEIKNWNKLTTKENQLINSLYTAMGDDFGEAIGKFVQTMKNIEGYGGMIVTGGDDHSKVAMMLAQIKKGRKGRYLSVPKSIDADAMVQMVGFNTMANHMKNRFWTSAVTGIQKKYL
ncbi:MAG: 6-phosphofructokinase [Candidatus Omnitrophota bacterium]